MKYFEKMQVIAAKIAGSLYEQKINIIKGSDPTNNKIITHQRCG